MNKEFYWCLLMWINAGFFCENEGKIMFYFDGKAGYLTVITGPMASEKSGELIQRCKKAEKYQHKKVVVFKPQIDNRFSNDEVVSRIGLSIPCRNLPIHQVDLSLYEKDLKDCDIVAIDEIQFFDESIILAVKQLLKEGKHVIVSGLNMDYLGQPFGQIGTLLAIADEIIQKFAYCACCGRPAIHTQRLYQGKPVTQRFESNIKIDAVGGVDTYEPRCRLFFVSKEAKQ